MYRVYILELEPGVWKATGKGDPPRTTQRKNAQSFRTHKAACCSLYHARKYREFPQAEIYNLELSKLRETKPPEEEKEE